jgi:hypothetical protein
MRRDRLRAALRRALPRDALAAALRRATGPGAREKARRAWAEVRRRPDAVAAAAFLAGVLAMILHWR